MDFSFWTFILGYEFTMVLRIGWVFCFGFLLRTVVVTRKGIDIVSYCWDPGKSHDQV